PFSRYIGTLLLLKGALAEGEIGIVIIGLLTSLLILYSILKIFIRGSWGEDQAITSENKRTPKGFIAQIAFLLTFSVLLGVGAEFIYPSIDSIATYLLDPESYIHSVLKE